MATSVLIFGVFLITFAWGLHIPPDIKLCHRSDPNVFECVGKNVASGLRYFASGNKYYGMPKIDPLFVQELVLKGEQSETVSIEQRYKNVYLHGISTSNAEQGFKMDLDKKCEWTMEVETPVLRLEADYELNGKLLLFPLNGHGKCNITMYDMLNTHAMVCEKYTLKGRTYLRLTNYTMNIRLGNIHYDFQEIFPGNEQISAEILKTINENGLAIFNDIKSGFEQAFSTIHIAVANKFFSKEPINEIFLD